MEDEEKYRSYTLKVKIDWEVVSSNACGLSRGLLVAWNLVNANLNFFLVSIGIIGKIIGFPTQVNILNV